MGLFSSLFGSSDAQRDGSSPERALIAASIAAEYQWIAKHHPGASTLRQALQFIDNKPFDVLTIQTPNGAEQEIYFDISEFFGK